MDELNLKTLNLTYSSYHTLLRGGYDRFVVVTSKYSLVTEKVDFASEKRIFHKNTTLFKNNYFPPGKVLFQK